MILENFKILLLSSKYFVWKNYFVKWIKFFQRYDLINYLYILYDNYL